MSCHDIGRGMNSVVEKIVELYDEGKYSMDTAKKLIVAARKGVHWCDGNEDEATASIRRCRCGRCLKKLNVGDFLFSVWDVSKEIPDIDEMLDRNRNDEPPLASDGLCEECFDLVLTKCCGDESAGEREKQ